MPGNSIPAGASDASRADGRSTAAIVPSGSSACRELRMLDDASAFPPHRAHHGLIAD
jgi:hypothetical protein